MKPYLDLLRTIMIEGRDRDDRTGTGTRSIFGYQMRFDLRDGFPLVTTKRLFTKGIIHELLWFLSGSTSVAPLQEAGVKIWDAWSTEEQCAKFGRQAGELGPGYGHQWVNFGATRLADGTYAVNGIDQIANVIDQIRTNPNSRRLIVSAWNPRDLDEVALPPCHTLFQFYVDGSELSLQLYQRSGDAFLGIPFNIASYALLLSMVAQVAGLKPRYFIHSLGDVHIYKNHFKQAVEQIVRDFRPLPRLFLNEAVTDIFSFQPSDISIEGYDPHPAIKAEVSV